MTAMIDELLGNSLAPLPAPGSCPVEVTPVLTVAVNSQAVLTIARRLHDRSCLDGPGCGLRDFHALDAYGTDVQGILTALVQAGTDGDSPEISTCRTTDRRWFQGQWWCRKCSSAVWFRAGSGWVHKP